MNRRVARCPHSSPRSMMSRTHLRVRASLVALAVVPLIGRAARADCSPPSGLATCIDTDTLWPHAGGSGPFLVIGSTETTAPKQMGVGIFTSYLARPLVLEVPSASPDRRQVDAVHRLVDTTFLWSLGLAERLEATVAVPVSLYASGKGVAPLSSTDPPNLPKTAIRDTRFGLAYRLLPRTEEWGHHRLGVAARFELSTPVGDEQAFAGDRGFVAIPSLSADYRVHGVFVGAEVGARLRKTTDLLGTRVGSQLQIALGVGVDVLEDRLLSVGVEGYALPTLVKQYDATYDSTSRLLVESDATRTLTPAEWMAWLRSAPLSGGDISFAIGAGGALPLTEVGAATTPKFRLSGAVQYAPVGHDRDHDGVPDRLDRCPDQPEDRDGFQDEDGCPDPDNDKDGIPDSKDRCRDAPETVDGFQDEDGCPDLDDDGDGVPDDLDQCRSQPEDKDGFEDADGCPDPDNDKDGILDSKDRCPNAAEDVDGYQDEDGCPDPDNDLDGIVDTKDRCPNEPEDKDGFEDEDGCPDPDNDHDGVLDAADKCPVAAETINGREDEDGCPEPGAIDLVSIERDAIRLATPPRFAPGASTMTPQLKSGVGMIAQKARAADFGVKLLVEAYADTPGDTAAHQKLAVARADALSKAFLQAGLGPGQVTAAVGDLSVARAANAASFDVSLVKPTQRRSR